MTKPERKVLFITPQPFFQWRGSPIRVGFDVRALADLGFKVDLLALPVGMDVELPQGVRLVRTPNLFRVKSMAIGPSFWKAVYDIILFFHALGLMCRNRYDILHGVEDAGVIAVVIAKLSGARAVFEKHSDPSSYRKGPLRNFILFLYSKMEAFSIRHAHAVIGTGPGLVEQAKKVSPKKAVYHIFDIPSSLAESNAEEVRDVRARLQESPDELLVTYVGSFAVYQGIDLMFDSMPHVVRSCPSIRFIVIGGSESEIAEKKAWLTERGAADAVTFLGKIPPDELPNYLAAADILLSPRIAGANTPLKILDYLKAGGAIVGADSAANRLILDESTALLVNPEPAAFAAGIARLVEDVELRNRLAAKGRGLIEELYNFSEFKRRIGVCYDSLPA